MKCTVAKKNGQRCRGQAKGGTPFCRFHSPDVADRALQREISHRGGLAKAQLYKIPSVDALVSDALVQGLDLESASGVKALLAAVLRKLTELPLDSRVATCIQQVAAAQKGYIAEADYETRFAELEARMKDK